MNERDHELFEAELRRLKPARLPDEFQARLGDLPPMTAAQSEVRRSAKTLVAQVSNLLYRGFPIRRRHKRSVSHASPVASRLKVGDTADWKSALRLWFRRLAPATVALLAVLVVVFQGGTHRNPAPPDISVPVPALKADQVEIDQQLLSSFDTVAEMPDGEPVRMRVNQWMDEVTLRDSASGVEVVQRTPRVKVVPVSFAVY